jgi:hypothetical protein
MLTSIGPSLGRAAVAIPASLLVLFVGLLWLLGLACGDKRRTYVTTISDQAMRAACAMFRGDTGNDAPTLARAANRADVGRDSDDGASVCS